MRTIRGWRLVRFGLFFTFVSPTSGGAIDAVVFDLGGVLVRIETSAVFRAVSRFVTKIPTHLANLDALYQHPCFHQFECGRISDHEFHESIERILGCSIPFDDFCHAWNSIFHGEIEQTVRILESLRKQPDLKTGILSNTNRLHFNWLSERMPSLREMEHVYASHKIGIRKPDLAAYRYVLEKMDVKPERSVFVDDLATNLDGARAIGMHVIYATSPDAVQSGLAALGVFCADRPPNTRII